MTEPWSLYTMDYFGPDGTPQIRLATPKMLFVCHFYDRPSELAFNALLVAEGIRPGAYVSSSGKDDEKWMVLLRNYRDLRFTKRSERFLVSLGDIETIPADAVAMGAFLGYCYPIEIHSPVPARQLVLQHHAGAQTTRARHDSGVQSSGVVLYHSLDR